MMVNSLGRELPEKVGSYTVRPYGSAAAETAAPARTNRLVGIRGGGESKLLKSIGEALEACGLRSGMTISFHHSFREGDEIILASEELYDGKVVR